MSNKNVIASDASQNQLVVCPRCLGKLESRNTELTCVACAASYQIINGIPCFAPSDDFYDQYAAVHCPYVLSPTGLKGALLHFLPFWSWREVNFWDKTVPQCERLLDIGCGRGRQLFAQRSRETFGFDVSLRYAQDCAAHYDVVAQGRLPNLPFPSHVFDVVLTSHVLGHIRPEHKDALISEMARVLRHGGISIHIIETDSEHPAVKAAKCHAETYRQQFLEQDGHIGLEPADRVIQRFAAHGFVLRSIRLVDAILPSLQNYRKYLKHPDFSDLPGAQLLDRLNRWTTSNSLVNIAYEVGMGIFHWTFEQWFGKPTFAQFIMTVFEYP